MCILPSNQSGINDVQCSLTFAVTQAIAKQALKAIAVYLILGYFRDIQLLVSGCYVSDC
ncbi:MAG: hypothetical protein ACRC1Z_05220 [Waterburya sp.]